MARCAVVAALVVVAFYGLSVVPDELIYDDELLIGKETAPRSLADVGRVFAEPHYGDLPYYRPLVRLTYLAQKALHGNAPAPYRWVNAGLVGLVLLAAYGLLRGPSLRIDGWAALLAAGWFALHPIASSCAYPVTGRETLLPVLLVLLAVAAWLREGTRWAVAGSGLFAAALLSKELAVVTPLLFVLADATLQRRRRGRRGWIARYLPVAVILAAYFVVRGVVLTGGRPELALADDPAGPWKSLAYGLQTLIAPTLELVYEPPLDAWFSASRLLASVAVVILLALGARKLWPEAAPRVVFWAGWVVAAQLSTANLLRQETMFDERYLFLASLGVAALVATVAAPLAGTKPARRTALVVALVWIVALAAVSRHRAGYFETPLVFHGQWAETNPTSANAHNGLGVALTREGRLDEAVNCYETAIRLNPEHELAHNNLGVALQRRGNHQAAERRFVEALRLRPRYAEAHYNLANTLAALGRLDEAETSYAEALRLRSGYFSAHNNYAALLARQGRIDEALRELDEAMRLEPDHFRSRLNYGILLARRGQFLQALPYYREALRLDPASPDAHYDLGLALENLGRVEEALRHYREALPLARAAGRDDLARVIEGRLAAAP